MDVIQFILRKQPEKNRIAQKIAVIMGIQPIFLPPLDVLHNPLAVCPARVQCRTHRHCRFMARQERSGVFRLGKPAAVTHKDYIVLILNK